MLMMAKALLKNGMRIPWHFRNLGKSAIESFDREKGEAIGSRSGLKLKGIMQMKNINEAGIEALGEA